MQRFAYRQRTDGWHQITCNLGACYDALVIEILINGMRDNPVLRHLQEGRDYIWDSDSQIVFRSLRHAAIFHLFCPH